MRQLIIVLQLIFYILSRRNMKTQLQSESVLGKLFNSLKAIEFAKGGLNSRFWPV